MPIPDMSDVLEEFSQPLMLSRVSQQIVDFHPVNVETKFEISAVIQPAQKEKINPDIIDWRLSYYIIHCAEKILIGDFVEYCGKKFKCIETANYSDYGFYESLFEEIK